MKTGQHLHSTSVTSVNDDLKVTVTVNKMRRFILCTILALVIVNSLAGRQYLHHAVRQAQAMHVLPHHSVIDKTAPGIQVAYYNIRPYQRANLHGALGASIPYDVLRSLEHHVDSIGKHHY